MDDDLQLDKMGSWLRSHRQERGWSLARTAEEASLNKTTIHRMENGEGAKLNTLFELTSALDVSLLEAVSKSLPGADERFVGSVAIRLACLEEENRRLEAERSTFDQLDSRLEALTDLLEQARASLGLMDDARAALDEVAQAVMESKQELARREAVALMTDSATGADLLAEVEISREQAKLREQSPAGTRPQPERRKTDLN